MSNLRLCLRTPQYGKELPGIKTSELFQYLHDSFPAPDDAHRVQHEHCLQETALLLSGLLEYQKLSKLVIQGLYFSGTSVF